MVYSRVVDDNVLTFAPSGWTYGEEPATSTFVLVDKETESLWFPMVDRECCALAGISAVYAAARANGIQRMASTTWAEWVSRHPATILVVK